MDICISPGSIEETSIPRNRVIASSMAEKEETQEACEFEAATLTY